MPEPQPYNLAPLLRERLPHHITAQLEAVGQPAAAGAMRLYLVGGLVRDLILGRRNLDVDVAIEGDVKKLATDLAKKFQGKVTLHPTFGTATLELEGGSIDLATARTETYPQPGALPVVTPGSIQDDLRRRDFSINAMAVSLNQDDFGLLLDPFDGYADLQRKQVRVLHEGSFIDDATRLFRAVRYAARFNFGLEPRTAQLLNRDAHYLDTISGERLQNELLRILAEPQPERALFSADQYGLLRQIHPALRFDSRLAEAFVAAREKGFWSIGAGWALLGLPLKGAQARALAERLALRGTAAQPLLQAPRLAALSDQLVSPDLSNSALAALLQPFPAETLVAGQLAFDGQLAAKRIRLYLTDLRQRHPALDGHALLAFGVPQGPKVGELLTLLHKGRLDGSLTSLADEEAFVRSWSAQQPR